MRILLVEDDSRIFDFLARALRSEGHSVVHCADGREALMLAQSADFDLMILDVLLPGLSGLEVCQALRLRGFEIPIVMLTALGDTEDVINGLRAGADDYLAKPFSIDELLVRIETVVRRGRMQPQESERLSIGELVLDRKTMEVHCSAERLALTAKEFAILELFMSQPGRVFSRERIFSNVWGLNMDPLTNVVEVHIAKIRKKMSAVGGGSSIETVRGLGYRLSDREASSVGD